MTHAWAYDHRGEPKLVKVVRVIEVRFIDKIIDIHNFIPVK